SLILDRLIELEEKKALSPYLPMLFSPYQSVILKVGNVNEEKIIEVKRLLESIGLKRVYLDLSNEKIGSKLRKWGMKWVPLVFIYGEREEETNTIILRERKTNVQYTISLSELEGAVKKFLETQ
ncbi:MAG: His/Gly/Thr/Pro-type tRNA ligase C-terminal domain-containing protein, partial [Fervidicoccus sp.]